MNKIEIFGETSIQNTAEIADETLKLLNFNHADVEISFVDLDAIHKLNLVHRQIDKPTDVLSFPQINIPNEKRTVLGNIFICEKMVEEKNENIVDVIKHGTLHLAGFDHETDESEWDRAAEICGCKL